MLYIDRRWDTPWWLWKVCLGRPLPTWVREVYLVELECVLKGGQVSVEVETVILISWEERTSPTKRVERAVSIAVDKHAWGVLDVQVRSCKRLHATYPIPWTCA